MKDKRSTSRNVFTKEERERIDGMIAMADFVAGQDVVDLAELDEYDDETLEATGYIALHTLPQLTTIGHTIRNIAEDQTDHNLFLKLRGVCDLIDCWVDNIKPQ